MFEREVLLQQFGESEASRSAEQLKKFAYIRRELLEGIAKEALSENWGDKLHVLTYYLSVHMLWSIQQGRYTFSENQMYFTAGHLQTRYGTPVYLVLEKNLNEGMQPWFLVAAGSNDIKASDLPDPPDIPCAMELDRSAEIVMNHDHILADHPERIPFLAQTPRVAQLCAIAGAIQWSINRDLLLQYWYFGKMQYLVPLYLEDREDISRAPNAVAPIQVSKNRLLVRTVMEPHMPYRRARVAVSRHDKLPSWLSTAWAQNAFQEGGPESDDLDPS